jgi:hypothetical protein
MLKRRVFSIIAILVGLTGFGAVALWQFSGPSELDQVRSHRDMSAEEQRQVLQMFFPEELPGQLLDVRIESFMPAIGDGEVRASFRVAPKQARHIASTLRRKDSIGAYTSEAFEHANGSIQIDESSGRVHILWSEY